MMLLSLLHKLVCCIVDRRGHLTRFAACAQDWSGWPFVTLRCCGVCLTFLLVVMIGDTGPAASTPSCTPYIVQEVFALTNEEFQDKPMQIQDKTANQYSKVQV